MEPFQEFANSEQILPYIRVMDLDPEFHIYPCLVGDTEFGVAVSAYGITHKHAFPFTSENLSQWIRDVCYEDMRRVVEWSLEPMPEGVL